MKQKFQTKNFDVDASVINLEIYKVTPLGLIRPKKVYRNYLRLVQVGELGRSL